MTVYPIIFNVGPLQITGYGIMMMIGFLMGGWLIGLELKRRGLRDSQQQQDQRENRAT
jgi:prolipoprotein diacylglyceryltransferase